jgi:hypothetical protein
MKEFVRELRGPQKLRIQFCVMSSESSEWTLDASTINSTMRDESVINSTMRDAYVR